MGIFCGRLAVAIPCFVGILALAACGEQNPLIGKWKLEKTDDLSVQSYRLAKTSGNAMLQFEKDRVVSGLNVIKVEYEVKGQRVTVIYDGTEQKNTYDIIDGNHFLVEAGEMGTFKYVRAE